MKKKQYWRFMSLPLVLSVSPPFAAITQLRHIRVFGVGFSATPPRALGCRYRLPAGSVVPSEDLGVTVAVRLASRGKKSRIPSPSSE